MSATARNQPGLSGRTWVYFSGSPQTPGANEYAVLLDTTNDLPNTNKDAPAKSATLPSPGTKRGLALGRQFSFMVSCTTQNVTLLGYYLHADGAWKQARSITITAGADPQSYVVDPTYYGSTELLVVALAGATPPGAVYSQITARTLP